jgi:demethoxyubiquinone hydroxylase (CLK1/Coq7/Cat5 family)
LGKKAFVCGGMMAAVGRKHTLTEVCTRTVINTDIHRRMQSSGMLRRVALVRSDVSNELSASIIRVTRIGELGATLAVSP